MRLLTLRVKSEPIWWLCHTRTIRRSPLGLCQRCRKDSAGGEHSSAFGEASAVTLNHKEVISAKLGRGDLRSYDSANRVAEEVTGNL
jgi:hypothetical protein